MMKVMNIKNALIGVAVVVLLSSPGMAGTVFVNGGFEAGDLSGWYASSDNGTPSWVAMAAGQSSYASASNGGLSSRIATPGSDARVGINRVYGGAYAAQVGDELAWGYGGGGTFYNRIKQSAAVTAEPDGSPGSIYFAWAAVEEISGHSHTQTPFFQVMVRNDTAGTTIYDVQHYEDDGGAWVNYGNGWKYSTNTNPADPAGWNVVSLNLASLASVGDVLTLQVIARDCSPTAHAMYVYVDGFGAAPPQPGPIPEPLTIATTLAGLGGLFGYIRRRRLAA